MTASPAPARPSTTVGKYEKFKTGIIYRVPKTDDEITFPS